MSNQPSDQNRQSGMALLGQGTHRRHFRDGVAAAGEKRMPRAVDLTVAVTLPQMSWPGWTKAGPCAGAGTRELLAPRLASPAAASPA